MKLEELKKLCQDITPGPWKYDWGNWEVEGPPPNRYPICSMTPDNRRAPFHGQAQNHVDSGADGEFIAAARNMLPKLIAVAEAASLTVYAEKKCSEPLYAYGVEQLRVTLAALESE